MAISDGRFRAIVIGSGALLALSIIGIRFCGSVSLPPKPEGVAARSERAPSDLLTASTESPSIYLDFLARDAAAAGVAVPTLADMARKLPHRVDEGRRVLEVGAASIEVAGLRLGAVHAGDTLALDIRNTTNADVAYLIASEIVPGVAGCNSARPLPLNAMVLAKQDGTTRVECVWRKGLAIAISRVETLELAPLQAWYVGQVPPAVVGIEDRVARGHRPVESAERCTAMQPQAVKAGLESGEIGWRDLVDFYARHRCQTYQFPLSYRAFTKDGQRALPAAGPDG